MSTFADVFPGKYTFLTVVHAETPEQSLRNARIAHDNGAHGIFLINHRGSHPDLMRIYDTVRRALPEFWIGVNSLHLGASAMAVIPKDTAGLWVDNAGVTDQGTEKAEEFARIREESGWHGLYFGGVAFKYQEPVEDVAYAAKLAVPFVDVITTSGPETGVAADVTKVERIRGAIGDHTLALASGVTPENVADFMPYVNCFLVATGISFSHTELNPKRTGWLARLLGR